MRIVVIVISIVAYIAAQIFIEALMTLVIESAYGHPMKDFTKVFVVAGAFIAAIPITVKIAAILVDFAKEIEGS